MKKLKHILFVLLVAGMLLPAIQKAFQLLKENPLHGDFVLAEKPTLAKAGWFSGSFQTQFDSYLEQHIGFRPFLVRLNNQLDFSLFRKANAEGVVIGKADFLYEYDYIRAYTGKDFVGEKIINEKMTRLKFLQVYLKDSLDIDLVLVFEPGKASFYPEFIPDRFLAEAKPETNYAKLLKTAKEINVNFLDLNQYFLNLKSKAKYPLFPKYGTHWSVYGMSFAADTMLKTIEQLRNIELLEVKHDSLFVSLVPLKTDNDVEKPMNLLISLPPSELAYPIFTFEEDTTITKPEVLVVADSYYWNIFNARIPKHVFANEAFWYFNAKVYPDSYEKPLFVRNLKLQKEVEKQHVVFLMVTERFMYKFDWGFIDDIYQLYTPQGLQSPVYDQLSHLLKDETLFASLLNKSAKNNISLEELLWAEAKYQFRRDDKKAYLQFFGPGWFEAVITADKKWSDAVAAKAKKRNISFDEMLYLDADYIFKQQYPGLHQKYHRTNYFKSMIKKDSSKLEQAKNLADFYHCPIERVIQYQAEMLVEEE